MNKYLLLGAVAWLGVGCAIVQDPSLNKPSTFEPLDDQASMATVEHGVVTVALVHQRSDIAVIAPQVEHVVWVRDRVSNEDDAPVVEPTVSKDASDPIIVAVADEPAVESDLDATVNDSGEGADEPLAAQREIIGRWPLLERDLDFDSELRRLDMCRPDNSGCISAGCGGLPEPCEEPYLYECFSTKLGDYCLEKSL